MVMYGTLNEISVGELIQYCCQLSSKSFGIYLQNGSKSAALFTFNGNIVHASFNGITGENVVFEVLTWNQGDYSVTVNPEIPVQSIFKSYTHLLLEGMTRIDEQQSMENASQLPEPQEIETAQPLDISSHVIDTLRRETMDIEGVEACVIVDWNSKKIVSSHKKEKISLDVESMALYNSEILSLQVRLIHELQLEDHIEDMLFTVSDQLHLVHMVKGSDNLLTYIVLDRQYQNINWVRHKLKEIEMAVIE